MDLEQLEKLRLMNQDLLKRLKANQEEFKKQQMGKSFLPALQAKRQPHEKRRAQDPQTEKEKQGQSPEELTSIAMRASGEAGPQVARIDLGSPSKPITSHKEKEGETPHQGDQDSHGAEKTTVLLATDGESARAAVKRCDCARDPERKSIPLSPTDAETHLAHLQRSRDGVEPSQVRAKGSHGPTVSARLLKAPKSILLTPQRKETQEKMKEAGRVMFVSDPEEYTLPADEWSVRPFLGYDWIAGLLDVDSSVSEKPEQYFSELQDFRRVNKEACIYDGVFRSEALGSWILDQESETESTSHQCIFCYRLNKRLFAMPVGSESACPICKTPRTQQHLETLVEPAFVRVSIPRSTLLPAYKHKIHRRKSYEPADDLALPSHCLAGWENPIQAFSPTLSSLDLRSTLAAESSGHFDWNLVSRVSGGTKTDDLLNVSRVTAFELSSLSRRWRHRKRPGLSSPSN
ncbi:migration and invasion-inhibitory protein isoform X2 [Sphaerodactylus townsendi]|uniref:migration and invasion-inhibitory protein isoform X2 n=1 Tax=Sphaerodactylus townsendi TaxID=933632 RepID=UPI0020262F4A|nr:migration and invasion-inhibitory protein isoform X2 [Sphaerodactylus townsendi]